MMPMLSHTGFREILSGLPALCGHWGCKYWPDQIPGQKLYKMTRRGFTFSLHYDVFRFQCTTSEMTYTVSGGVLNSTHTKPFNVSIFVVRS